MRLPVSRPPRGASRTAPLARLVLAAGLLLGACGEPGGFAIDPSVVDRPLPGPDTPRDTALARAGAEVYRSRCVACHRLDEGGVAVGPPLGGVVEQRDPDWLRGMILRPDSMLRTDPLAQELLRQYRVPMPDTRIGEPEFRALLEYLRAAPEP